MLRGPKKVSQKSVDKCHKIIYEKVSQKSAQKVCRCRWVEANVGGRSLTQVDTGGHRWTQLDTGKCRWNENIQLEASMIPSL